MNTFVSETKTLCINCGEVAPDATLEECPQCGLKKPWMRPADLVVVGVNWEELRRLVCAAELGAEKFENAAARDAITAIARRLEDQFPSREALLVETLKKRVKEELVRRFANGTRSSY